ncbi:MAG TPA: hypothetical protein VIY69_14160 [Candidatus Acidoferrales bacterium]
MKIYKLGRALFGAYFIYNGIHHFMKKNEMARYAEAKEVPSPDAAERQKSMIDFGKDMALLSGALALADAEGK